MSEIEKMYENAGVKKQYDYIVIQKNYNGKIAYTKRAVLEKVEQFKNKTLRIIEVCPFYPDFTAEKQLELIKWLAKTRPIYITFLIDKWVIEGMVRYGKRYDTFEDALSGYINNIWQTLTEQERTEIAEILK